MKSDNLCRHLRTKSMFVASLEQDPPPHDPNELGHAPHCWCNCTLTETGPDNHSAGREFCRPGRGCFEE